MFELTLRNEQDSSIITIKTKRWWSTKDGIVSIDLFGDWTLWKSSKYTLLEAR